MCIELITHTCNRVSLPTFAVMENFKHPCITSLDAALVLTCIRHILLQGGGRGGGGEGLLQKGAGLLGREIPQFLHTPSNEDTQFKTSKHRM